MWSILLFAILALANALDPRIAGGSDTTINNFPYQVSIHLNGKFWCGGSIISQKWVLTAAHCVIGQRPTAFQIRIQSTYTNNGGILISDIKDVMWHPGYAVNTLEYDAALIELRSPISVTATSRPIVLADSQSAVSTGSKAVVTGWGLTSFNGAMSETLQMVTVPVVDQTTCKNIYKAKHPVTNTMLCAGDVSNSNNACRGDSGGPLVYNGVQIGIVSWGYKCAEPGYPGVYARVSSVRSWITKQTSV